MVDDVASAGLKAPGLTRGATAGSYRAFGFISHEENGRLTSQKKTLKLKEVKYLAQSHLASKGLVLKLSLSVPAAYPLCPPQSETNHDTTG